jgi:ribose/xylose/arabinose/galactoside ABC-type transport system permease subunit
MNAAPHPPRSNRWAAARSGLNRALHADAAKLLLALVGVFAFFVLAVAFESAWRARGSNQVLAQRLEREGVPRAEWQAHAGWVDTKRAAQMGALRFLGLRNLETLARQTTIVGFGALGMTLVIISGGIDLSVGSLVALGTVVIAWFLGLRAGPWMPPAAAGMAILACGAFGCLSGLLITRLRVVPFIVTLGMMLLVRGTAKGLSREQRVDAPETWLNGLLASLAPSDRWMLVPPGVWLLVAASVAIGLVLRYSRFGRYVFAIGSNEQTARLCGVPVERVKLGIYTLGGLFGGMAGIMQFSRLTVGDPTVAVGLELDVIAAVVIGGGSLSGGEGSVLGSLVGALIMSVIRAGCSQMGLPNWVQEIITGIIIIAAVAIDRLRHRRLERG